MQTTLWWLDPSQCLFEGKGVGSDEVDDLTEDTRKLLGMDNIQYFHCSDDLTGLHFVKTYQIVHLTYVQLITCHLYPVKLFYKKGRIGDWLENT